MNKKLLIVIDSLNCGGGEKSLLSLLPYLKSYGFDITIGLFVRGGVFEKLLPSDIKVIDIKEKFSR